MAPSAQKAIDLFTGVFKNVGMAAIAGVIGGVVVYRSTNSLLIGVGSAAGIFFGAEFLLMKSSADNFFNQK